jgi:hypothetical protein
MTDHFLCYFVWQPTECGAWKRRGIGGDRSQFGLPSAVLVPESGEMRLASRGSLIKIHSMYAALLRPRHFWPERWGSAGLACLRRSSHSLDPAPLLFTLHPRESDGQ